MALAQVQAQQAGSAPGLSGTDEHERAYRAARDFLFYEAELVDDGRFTEWLGLLTDDVSYRAPVRVTRERGSLSEVSGEMFHFDENATTLRWRVERLKTEFAWAEDPPSRTRHVVSNIRVQSAAAGEIAIRSYLLVYRNRGSDARHDLLSGERFDTLRRVPESEGGFGGWKLARRVVILDQATLGTKNLGIFL